MSFIFSLILFLAHAMLLRDEKNWPWEMTSQRAYDAINVCASETSECLVNPLSSWVTYWVEPRKQTKTNWIITKKRKMRGESVCSPIKMMAKTGEKAKPVIWLRSCGKRNLTVDFKWISAGDCDNKCVWPHNNSGPEDLLIVGCRLRRRILPTTVMVLDTGVDDSHWHDINVISWVELCLWLGCCCCRWHHHIGRCTILLLLLLFWIHSVDRRETRESKSNFMKRSSCFGCWTYPV